MNKVFSSQRTLFKHHSKLSWAWIIKVIQVYSKTINYWDIINRKPKWGYSQPLISNSYQFYFSMLLEHTALLMSIVNLLIQCPHRVCSDHSSNPLPGLPHSPFIILCNTARIVISFYSAVWTFSFLPLEITNLEMLIPYLKCVNDSSCHFSQLTSHRIFYLDSSIWVSLKLSEVLYILWL